MDEHMSVLEGSANAIPRRVMVSEENYENWIDEQETFESLMAKNNGKLKTTRIAKSNK